MVNIRPAVEADIERILALNAQGFNTPTAWSARIRKELRLEHWRVAEDHARITGVARCFPFAHFYGGNAVPAAGVASVAVAAEARGRGTGSVLMREILREARASGHAISSLYPATVPLYRTCGYGFGMIRTVWTAALNDLPQHNEHHVLVEAFDESAIDELRAAYEQIARGTNGLAQRDHDWWMGRVLSGWDDAPRYCYLVREAGAVTGWIVYTLAENKDTWQFKLQCRDLFWTTPGSGGALLSLASLHRSTARRIEWIGPPDEPLLNLTDDHAIEMDHAFRVMVRLLDVPAAIEARGYHPLIEAGVSIAVRDPLFSENEGPWRIEVSGGRAKVVPSDTAEATADVQTWASIWSSLHRARDAVRTGGLSATDAAIDALDLIFGGPLPWLADFY